MMMLGAIYEQRTREQRISTSIKEKHVREHSITKKSMSKTKPYDKIRVPSITSGFDCKMKSTFGIVFNTIIELVTSSCHLLLRHYARFRFES